MPKIKQMNRPEVEASFYLIYKISNTVNNKVYIGQTRRSLKRRLTRHSKNNHCPKLFNAISKYGLCNFRIVLITMAHSQEVANLLERQFIKQYNSVTEGYNVEEGGSDNKGVSIETREKISKALKGKQKPPRSKEHSINMSLSRVGKTHSEETKIKISESGKGKHSQLRSNETKQKISEARKGKFWTEARRKAQENVKDRKQTMGL